MEKECIDIYGEKIDFFVQRKKVKNINLRVNIDKQIIVSIPENMEIEIVRDFVKSKVEWIKKQQSYYNLFTKDKECITFENGETVYLLGKQYKIKIVSDIINNISIKEKYFEIHIKDKYIKDKEYIKGIYNTWLKEYSKQLFNTLTEKYHSSLKKYDIQFPQIEVRTMKSRWGSCLSNDNKVIYNLNLIKTPICCIEYVVLHELSHFRYQNHSKNFYNFITIFMPDWKERKKILDEEYFGIV